MAEVNLNPNEVKVLAALASVGGDSYLTFSGIGQRVQLTRPVIRRACRSLARKGLAQFGRGLWTEDGDLAGSGYAATKAGLERADAMLGDRIAERRGGLVTTLEFHPLANLFPLIEGKDFEEFCAGIKADGILHDKIVLLDGQILDGRNRQRACDATGITPHYETFNPKIHGDPLTFVVSKNLRRRHLTPSQRAQIAAETETLRHGGDRKSDQDANLHLDRSARAEQFGVSERSIATAAEVRDRGAPELVEAVKAGEVTVSAAAEIVRALPVEDQRKLLADVAEAPDTKKAFSGVVKDIRRKKQDEKKAKRAARERDLGARLRVLPDKKYGVILADPEWPFDVWSEDTGQDRAAKNHYPTSPIEEIMARPVASIAADDAVLFLWATAPKLPDALRVMEAWGFAYVTHAIWVKDKIGTGYWFRNNHEIMLLGKRGDPPKPADGTQWHSALAADRAAHSEKPDWQYEIPEAYFPTLPKIELNARRRRDGWDAWGLEAPEPDNIITLPGSSSIPPDIGVGPDESEFDSPETKAALRASLDVDELNVMREAMEGPGENEAAESAEAGGPSREDGSADPAPIPVSAASPYRFTVVTWRGPPTEHMPEEPWARITVEAGTPDDFVTEKIAEVLAANPMIPADRVSVAIEIPSGSAASNGGTHEEVAPQPPTEIDRSEAVGMPQQPAASDSDDDMEIPPGLRVGDPANAWAKRGEGG